MFNLRQLMRLEEERVEAQEVAAREQRAARERALQAAAAEASERERLQEAARERMQLERDAVLLRVQLEAAAAERARDAELERTHADRVAALQARHRARSARLAAFALAGVMLASAGAWWRIERTASAAQSEGRAAQHALATQQRELSALRQRLTQLLTDVPHAPAVMQPATPPSVTVVKPKAVLHPKPKLPMRRPASGPHDDGLDFDTDDPIEGASR